ncbi:MAG: hypothetical protein KAR33_01445 [Candidatus Thorarchaeota archaeon]|nr:hypothetical protein [Candidatus Thorarchaeota archaeon]
MKKPHTVQTRLTDFEERDSSGKKVNPSNPPKYRRDKRPPAKLWRNIIKDGEVWGVFEGDDTVLFVQILDGKIYAHGREAVCKYCSGTLEIRGSQIFCAGECGVYQGNFSYDLNAYLKWDGAKSLTLRKAIAKEEGLSLEERDHEPIHYTPQWSVLYEFEEESDASLGIDDTE